MYKRQLNKKLDDKIVEEVVLDNKVLTSDDNDVNYNSESIVGVKNSGEQIN